MQFAVVCNQDDQWEGQRIYDEAQRAGLDVSLYNYDTFSLSLISGKLTILYDSKPWLLPNMAVFRSANYNEKKIKFEELAYVLRDSIVRNGGDIFNYTGMNIGTFGKLRQQYDLARSGFAHIDSFYGLQKPPYLPIVAKPLHGSSGDGVQLVTDESQIGASAQILLQAVMEAGCDYRIMIVGGKALGAIERRAQNNAFVANVSKGAQAKKVTLSPDVLQLAVTAANLFGLEYAGVDLIKDQVGKWHVLEINRFAQFRGFEEATGVNVAQEIVSYLQAKQPLLD